MNRHRTLALTAIALGLGLVAASCSSESISETNPPAADAATSASVDAEPSEVTVTDNEDDGAATYVVAVHDASTGEYTGVLNEDERVEAMLLDDRTIVFAANTDTYNTGRTPPTTHTPTRDQVDAVLETLGSAPELEWATGHTRFLRGNDPTGDGPHIAVDLACGLPSLTDGIQAMAVLREEVHAVVGGGSCYGWALFTLDGELVRWGDNGES